MRTRVLKVDVEHAFGAYVAELKRHDINTEGIELHHGSKHYGNSFKVLQGGSRPVGVQFGGFIGWTRREAYETLWYITRTMFDVREARKQQPS